MSTIKEVLGNKCAHPGCNATEDLSLDCIVPQGARHHRIDRGRRATFYWRQFKANNLQLLCKKHNDIKQDYSHEYHQQQDPF